MHEAVAQVLAPHRGHAALVDANLLLLYIIGSLDPHLITSFKRTRQFDVGDYALLTEVLATLGPVVTTPNVLTEVSNLANQLPERQKPAFYERLGEQISVLDERVVASRDVGTSPTFRRFGLTDAVIERIAGAGLLVLTVDLPLSGHLQKRGLSALNFNHVRFLR